MIISKIKSGILLLFLFTIACTANYTVKPDEFVNQVAEEQYISEKPTNIYLVSTLATLFFNNIYYANNINKVKCIDKNGNILYLFPDRNTQLEITSISTNDVVKMYFDTVFFKGNKLIGLRSRLLPGMTREIELSDIGKIEIYAEFPRTEKVVTK